MDESLQYLERLAAAARQELPPAVDVAQSVILRLQQRQTSESPILALVAMGAAVAAAIAIIMSVSLVDTITDPMAMLFEVISVIEP